MTIDPTPAIAVIGGSGLCRQDVFPVVRTIRPATAIGTPSDDISLCRYVDAAGRARMLAFLPRHGRDHTIAPHAVPYRANLAALASLGVKQVIATCIVGSLRRRIRPGSWLVPHQFVNLTWGRDAPPDGPPVHLPLADPYCDRLRTLLARNGRQHARTHSRGTVAVIQGPRFSTRAESRWLARQGWHVVNMTQYPESTIARELGLCYAAVAAVTDYDVGVARQKLGFASGRSIQPVLDTFRRNVDGVKRLLADVVLQMPLDGECACSSPFPPEYYKQTERTGTMP